MNKFEIGISNIKNWLLGVVLSLILINLSCKKDKTPAEETPPVVVTPPNKTLSYANDILFTQENNASVLAKPIKNPGTGNYSSFPDGLVIDEKTGEINLNKSETGLKYKVTFVSDNTKDTASTLVTVAGINYDDGIYNLSLGDSIAKPFYNANHNLKLPEQGNIFDEDGGCKKAGIIIDNKNAIINLAQSVRNQAIDTGATEEVKLAYRINDDSKRALNNLRVKIYFYRNSQEIPKYLSELLKERKTTILNENITNAASVQTNFITASKLPTTLLQRQARPRPPCIIVVSR